MPGERADIGRDAGYKKTRDAWRDIWLGEADFEAELATLEYPRAQETLAYYTPLLPHGKPILEAGCGLGHLVHYLRGRGHDVIGLDYVPGALEIGLGHDPDMPLVAGDVHYLPFPDETFGAYLSFGVLEHFEHGPVPALQEAYRVLAPGGLLVLTIPYPNFVERLYELRRKLLPRPDLRAEYFETTYTHSQVADFVRQAGFEIEQQVPISHSYVWYGLGGPFRAEGYYANSRLADVMGNLSKALAPWFTCAASLTLARKPL